MLESKSNIWQLIVLAIEEANWFPPGTEEFDMDLYRKTWRCDKCGEELWAFTEANLAIKQRLHVHAHTIIWVANNPFDYLHLRQFREWDQVQAKYIEHDDVTWLTDMGIDVETQDTRTPVELAMRYKAGRAKGGTE